jgi:hypothetical protein
MIFLIKRILTNAYKKKLIICIRILLFYLIKKQKIQLDEIEKKLK